MEITFYKKGTHQQKVVIHRKPSLKPKSKPYTHFADFKGLTLREYFALSENPTKRNSDNNEDKGNDSFEELPNNASGKMSLGAIKEDTMARNATEMGEMQLKRYHQRLRNRSILAKEKASKDDTCQVVKEEVFSTFRTRPSQTIINNSLALLEKFRKRKRTSIRHASYAHQENSPLIGSIKPIHQPPKLTLPKGSKERHQPRVSSYQYPLQHGNWSRSGKLREMLQKMAFCRSASVEGEMGKWVDLVMHK